MEEAPVVREEQGPVSILTMQYRPYNLLGPTLLGAIADGIVPPDLEVKVRLAASYCPELAANDCIHRVIDTYHIRTHPLEGDDNAIVESLSPGRCIYQRRQAHAR